MEIEEIEEMLSELGEMKVELSPEPQTEPYSYVHEVLSEIHRHGSRLTDLIVRANRAKAKIDNAVQMKKSELDLLYSEALVTNPDVIRRKSATDRKAAATQIVKQQKEELSDLLVSQTEVHQLCKSLSRKDKELKAKSIDVKLQQKVIEAERSRTHFYGSGSGRGRDWAPKDTRETEEEDLGTDDEARSPSAKDLGIEEELGKVRSKSRKSTLGKEVVSPSVEEDISLEVLTPADDSDLSEEELSESSPTPFLVEEEEQDLDALIEEDDEQDLDALVEEELRASGKGKTDDVATKSEEEVPLEPEDLDSLLDEL